jgi:hypothetical protein
MPQVSCRLSSPSPLSPPSTEKSPTPLLMTPKSDGGFLPFMSPMKSSSESARLPSLVRKGGLPSLSSSFSGEFSPNNSSPVPVSPIKKSKRRVTARTNTKEFKGLVALINHASKSGGESGTVAVLKRWEELAKIG